MDTKISQIVRELFDVAQDVVLTRPDPQFGDYATTVGTLRFDAGEAEKLLGEFRKAGVDLAALAAKLQDDGAASFVASWNNLLGVIASKGSALARAS